MDAMELIRRFRKENFSNRSIGFRETLVSLYAIAGKEAMADSWQEPERESRVIHPEEREPGFPPDASQVLVRARSMLVAGIAGQIMAASVVKIRTATGGQDVSFMSPKECAEMAAEIWIESAEAVRNMDGA